MSAGALAKSDPIGRAYSASPDSLSGFKGGGALRGRREMKGRGGKD